MKKLGLVGGTSWHSTILYYRNINSTVNAYFGDNTNPPLAMVSLDQRELHSLQSAGRWDEISRIYREAIADLASIGCEGVVLCANTPHIVFDAVRDAAPVQMLHIADAVGERARELGLTILGILGTIHTLRHDLYGRRLRERFGIEVHNPGEADAEAVERIIKDELTFGILRDPTKRALDAIVGRLVVSGARGIVLGCTELSLLPNEGGCAAPLLDTTELHCRMAVDFILGESRSLQPALGDSGTSR